MYVFTFFLRFFFKIQKTWLFTFFWVVAHVFPNSGSIVSSLHTRHQLSWTVAHWERMMTCCNCTKHLQGQLLGDLFEDMFTQADEEEEPELAAIKCKVSIKPLLAEIDEFRDSRNPMRDHTDFWKFSRLTRLQDCTQIIFSVPVSSACIERLFSAAGVLLTDERKRKCCLR